MLRTVMNPSRCTCRIAPAERGFESSYDITKAQHSAAARIIFPPPALPTGLRPCPFPGVCFRTTLNPNPADITEVMGDIGKLLDTSITGVGMPAKPAPVMDLSKIDFEALRTRFNPTSAVEEVVKA